MTKEGRHSKFLIKAAIVALFILGQLVIMCGFLIEYADDVPWVYKLIAPTYSRASQGTRQLVESSGHTLGYHDVGFCEVSNILSNHFVDIQTNLPGGNGHLINIVQISFSSDVTVGGEPFSPWGMISVVTYNPELAKISPQLVAGVFNNFYPYDRLKNDVESLRRKSVFIWALIFIVCGSVIEFLAFLIDFKEFNDGDFNPKMPATPKQPPSVIGGCDI